MSKIFYDDICLACKCEHCVEWEYDEVIQDSKREHRSTIECISCDLVGPSYNITEYPDECPYKKELEEFKKQVEKDRMWRKLGKPNT
jgi:hypothetical protein